MWGNTGIVTGEYAPGQWIDVSIEVTTQHLGYFVFKVCPSNNFEQDPDQDCFDRFKIDLISVRFFLFWWQWKFIERKWEKYDKVGSRGQFHQCYTRSFYIPKLRAQLFCAYVLGLYFTSVSLLAQKLCVECWWNWPKVSDLEVLPKLHSWEGLVRFWFAFGMFDFCLRW